MTFTEFKATLTDGTPPGDLGLPLQALWYAANDSWEAAHNITQDEGDPQLDWVHAYLHRVEGDESNAAHWYRRANQPVYEGSLDDEWSEIARSLLSA